MAFLAPSNLKCMTLVIPATASDLVVGYAREDMKLFYLDVIVPDVGASYTSGTLTLEFEPVGGGTDTEIDAITLTSPALAASLDFDDFTTNIIPAGNQLIATIATLADVSLGFLIAQLWYWPLSEN